MNATLFSKTTISPILSSKFQSIFEHISIRELHDKDVSRTPDFFRKKPCILILIVVYSPL